MPEHISLRWTCVLRYCSLAQGSWCRQYKTLIQSSVYFHIRGRDGDLLKNALMGLGNPGLMHKDIQYHYEGKGLLGGLPQSSRDLVLALRQHRSFYTYSGWCKSPLHARPRHTMILPMCRLWALFHKMSFYDMPATSIYKANVISMLNNTELGCGSVY